VRSQESNNTFCQIVSLRTTNQCPALNHICLNASPPDDKCQNKTQPKTACLIARRAERAEGMMKDEPSIDMILNI
jgi:hypothetical protein